MARTAHNLVWLSEVDKSDGSLVGAKGVVLGELAKEDLPIPKGFIITSNAYYDFIRENNFLVKINHLLSSANFNSPKSLEQIAKHIQNLIAKGTLSEDLIKEIIKAYKKIGGLLDESMVSIIPSFTNEHPKGKEAAGKALPILNIKGDAVLIDKIKYSWGQVYSASNLFKRHENGDLKLKTGIALIIQNTAPSSDVVSVETIDAEKNDKSVLIIDGTYKVRKQDLEILEKSSTKLSDKNIKKVAELAIKLEKLLYFPQIISFGMLKEKVYILDTKPLTFFSETDSEFNNKPVSTSNSLTIQAEPAGAGIATGPLRYVLSENEFSRVMPGDVLVLNESNEKYLNVIKKASAVVTLNGGKSSHAAITARRFGIPAISNARELIKGMEVGHIVTVNGTKGEIYKGGYKITTDYVTPGAALKTATKLYVTLSSSGSAEIVSKLNPDGINPLTAEAIIKKIGVHPKKMIRDEKKEVFVEKLSQELEKICKAFGEKSVVYRFSNLKSDDYRSLTGGKDFELLESNSTLGFRGAFRYLHDKESFEMEIAAIKKVREKGYKSLSVAIPFARTPGELESVKKIINSHGLQRSANFKVWFVLETPSNVIMLEKFLDLGVDGVLIDLNMLSMLTIGTDKENFEVSSEFSNLDASIIWSLEQVIKTCQKHKVLTSLFGLGVSENFELIKKLIGFGIDSLSVLPDVIEYTKQLICQTEKNLILK